MSAQPRGPSRIRAHRGVATRRWGWPAWILVASGVALVACVLSWVANRTNGARPSVVSLAELPCVAVVIWASARGGRGWRWLAAAVACYWAADACWYALGTPDLSWADGLYLIFRILLVVGAVRCAGSATRRPLRFWLDTGIVVLSGYTLEWYAVVAPALAAPHASALAAAVNLSYVLSDLAVLFVVGAAVLGVRHDVRPASDRAGLGWVVVSLLLLCVADGVYNAQSLAQTYAPHGVSDIGWMAVYWTMGVAAVASRQARTRPSMPTTTDAAPVDTKVGWRDALPYGAVVLAFGVLTVAVRAATRGHAGAGLTGVLALTAAAVALVVGRQILAMAENAVLHAAHVAHRAREAAASAAAAAEARFRALVQHSTDVVLVLDPGGILRFASPAVERVLGLRADSAVGRTAAAFVHPDDLSSFTTGLARLAAASNGDATETRAVTSAFRMRRADGAWRHVESVGTDQRADPAVGGFVFNVRDVTDRATLEAELAHRAYHDSLTGLANRALFRDRVEHALARLARSGGPASGGSDARDGDAPGSQVAVLFLDLDDFKTVNDSLGHAAGDRLLAVVAARLLNATRGCDTVARFGGDEFAVLIENARGAADVRIVAERITAALRAPVQVGDATPPSDVCGGAAREAWVGVSVGIAFATPDLDADALLRNADAAMYRAKADGKGRYAEFDPALHAAATARLELEADLAHALARHEFAVVFQPIVALTSGAVTSAETLVRWRHPTRGVVSPTTFIPVAEATGLIVELGRWVLQEACRAAAAWPLTASGAPAGVTVNVSGRQLLDPALPEHVAGALTSAGLPAARLTLEITESVVMQDTEAALAQLHALKALGVQLAIDDFGTGYSSLSYLQRFPIDVLKIDKSFVDGVARGGQSAALARTIVALGDMLGLRTVAEGIEDATQSARLRAMGCEFGQGYFFARPLDDDLLRTLLTTPLPQHTDAVSR